MARVLVVDDEITTVEMLSKALSLFGHDPVPAYNGEHALGVIAADPPHLVLLDLMMPGMDGYQTLRELRQLPGGRDLPVIVVTAVPDPDLDQRVSAAGGDGLIRKPVDLGRLAEAIEAHTRRN